MDYEKKYKDALEKLKPKMKDINDIIISREDIEEIFPELKESEGEKIMKEIINYFRCQSKDEPCRKTTHEKWIAWLEKQGEKKATDKVESMEHSYITTNSDFFQWIYDRLKYVYNENPNVDYMLSLKERIEDMKKPANKVETKFNVGDWITDGYSHNKITDVLEDRYIVETKFVKRSAILFNNESRYHLWTIQDAKNGDVLVGNKGSVILMFRGIGNTKWNDVIDYHCYYNCYREDFIVQKDVEYWGKTKNNQLKPATKEQRDTLMKAMSDAGYTFDFENRELKKIHVIDEGKAEMDYCFTKMMDGEKVSSAWSIEDEQNLNAALSYINDDSICRWLKDVIHVKYDKYTWSEEDEKHIMAIDLEVRRCIGKWHCCGEKCPISEHNTWLKSLKDRVQPQWKPSDGQMRAIGHICDGNYKVDLDILDSIYRDFKKLRRNSYESKRSTR